MYRTVLRHAEAGQLRGGAHTLNLRAALKELYRFIVVLTRVLKRWQKRRTDNRSRLASLIWYLLHEGVSVEVGCSAIHHLNGDRIILLDCRVGILVFLHQISKLCCLIRVRLVVMIHYFLDEFAFFGLHLVLNAYVLGVPDCVARLFFFRRQVEHFPYIWHACVVNERRVIAVLEADCFVRESAGSVRRRATLVYYFCSVRLGQHKVSVQVLFLHLPIAKVKHVNQ